MTTRGMTFTAESVRALMTCAQCGTLSPGVCSKCGSAEKAKTQTRRVMKLRDAPEDCGYCNGHGYEYIDCGTEASGYDYRMPCRCCIPPNIPKPGDIMYAKEAWRVGGWDEDREMMVVDYKASGGPLGQYQDVPDEKMFERLWHQSSEDAVKAGLAADSVDGYSWAPGESPCRWRSSRFMPRWAARIWLEITDVRAEWLQDISEEDACRESIRYCDGAGAWFYEDFVVGLREDCDSAAEAYLAYWDSLYNKRPERQSVANPMVWVYGLKPSSREAAEEKR